MADGRTDGRKERSSLTFYIIIFIPEVFEDCMCGPFMIHTRVNGTLNLVMTVTRTQTITPILRASATYWFNVGEKEKNTSLI